jgi:hypothetical protein
MKTLDWQKWLVLAAFVIVLMVTGLFAVRTVRRAVYWRHHRDEPIRPWMSLPYVAHSYRVPPRVLYEALGIPHPPRDRRPIKAIAREKNVSVDELINTLQRAIAGARQANAPNSQQSPDLGRSP